MKTTGTLLSILILLPIISARLSTSPVHQRSLGPRESLRRPGQGGAGIIDSITGETQKNEVTGGQEVDVGPSNDGDGCTVSLQATCTLVDTDTPCESLVPSAEQCVDRPMSLSFRYTGGGCELSSNAQDSAKCAEGRARATLNGTEAFIIVSDPSSQVYFSDFVAIGSEFEISDVAGLPATIMIDIHTSDEVSAANKVESIAFNPSCQSEEDPFFLFDRFGSLQVLEYTNVAQQTVSSLIPATYTFTIFNDDEDDLILEDFRSLSDIGAWATERISGVRVLAETGYTVQQGFLIDMSDRIQYNVMSTVQAKNDAGYVCAASGTLEFEAGTFF